MPDLRVLHVVGRLDPKAGGLSRAVVDLTDRLAFANDWRVTLVAQSVEGVATVCSENPRVLRIVPTSAHQLLLALGLPVRRALRCCAETDRPSILHSHGVWASVNHWAARCARRWAIPLVVHPHGMLEPWAMARRAWKKQLALHLYQRRDLRDAALFFATAVAEAESLRRIGLKQPIAVIPNGVRVPAPLESVGSRPRPGAAPRTALFLSRVHPQKGLLNLLAAWGRVRPANWRLLLAGPDGEGHLREVMQRIDDLGLRDSVHYLGEVDGAAKADAFSSADLFVLPSFSESFGLVVAEALAHGVPVIATRGTPWSGLVARGCGWWVEPSVDGLADVLQAACALDAPTLAAMGARGRVYARDFDWAEIARETVAAYRWVLGLGSKPDSVVTE